MFDYMGVFLLVAFIALFGFLTTRAWKLKNVILKWGGAVLAGLLTLIGVVLLGLGLRGFVLINQKYDNPVADIQVARTEAQIARGQQLANNCANCHTPGDSLPLSGVDFAFKFDLPPLGTLYSPNLTPGNNIDDWTDGELIRAIREGIHKDGRSLWVMPANNYRHLSDDDVQAIVAYLRTQPPTGDPTPTNQYNLLGALFLNLSDFRTAQAPVSDVPAPPPNTPEYGQYLVNVLGCRDCHGDQLQGRVADGMPGPTPGPNLTTAVPFWTEAQFMTFFNTGQYPSGSTVPILMLPSGYSEPRMPWSAVRAATTDDELKSIYAYLKSLPPVDGPAK